MLRADPIDVKGLPQAVPAEQLILGGILNGSLDFINCRATLSADDFVLEVHRMIYTRMERMRETGIAIDRVTVAQGRIDTQILRRGLDFDRAKIRVAASEVADLPIYIRDRSGCTIPQIHGALRKLKAERNIAFAVVDYLQLIAPVGRFDSRTNEVSHLSRGLKNIAVDLKIPIIALSQFKRVGDVPRRPQLSDLRESGSIEQDANVVILLHAERIEAEMEVFPMEVIVAKQRNGPVGTLMFGFHKAHGVFSEVADVHQLTASRTFSPTNPERENR